MLVIAKYYKDEIHDKLSSYRHSDDMLYFAGRTCVDLPTAEIATDNNGTHFKYAIVEGDKLIGYFEYTVDWLSSCAKEFRLFSFDRGNSIIGRDVYRRLKSLINSPQIHRIEWTMVSGNPVEKHYNRLCNKYHGKKLVLTDAVKEDCGKYRDVFIYEIIVPQ